MFREIGADYFLSYRENDFDIFGGTSFSEKLSVLLVFNSVLVT